MSRLDCEYRITAVVSVILPTHNRAQLLQRAISSVLTQTFRDLELIVVDDCSSENIREIVEAFSDPRVEYIRHDINRGASAARNTGIRNARGNLIAFLDSDDTWDPTKLEKQVNLLDRCDSSVGAIGAGRELKMRRNGNMSVVRMIPTERIGNIYRDLLSGRARVGVSRWPGGTPAIMIRRECFDKVGLFDESLLAAQDYDLYMRIARYYNFAAVPEPLVIIDPHDGKRISTSSYNQIQGRKDFLAKYASAMPLFSILKSVFSYQIGFWLLADGKVKEGRRYLIRAILACPYNLKTCYRSTRLLIDTLRAAGRRQMEGAAE